MKRGDNTKLLVHASVSSLATEPFTSPTLPPWDLVIIREKDNPEGKDQLHDMSLDEGEARWSQLLNFAAVCSPNGGEASLGLARKALAFTQLNELAFQRRANRFKTPTVEG